MIAFTRCTNDEGRSRHYRSFPTMADSPKRMASQQRTICDEELLRDDKPFAMMDDFAYA